MDDLSEPNIGTSAITGDFYLYLGGGIVTSDFTSNNVGNNIWRVSGTRVSETSALTYNGIYKATGNSSKGFRVVGWQIEAGSYPTSYIPTVASSVTRNADVISKTGISSLIGQTEGTLFVETLSLFNSLSRDISLSDGTLNNRITIGYLDVNGRYTIQVIKGGVIQVSNTFITINQSLNNKIALSYKENLFKLFINGVLVFTDSLGETFLPNTLSMILLNRSNGQNVFTGNLNKLQLYKTALTDEQCINLTTI